MWNVTCQCGHTDWWQSFATYMGRVLVADQWHCPACQCAWKCTKDGVKILRQPKPMKAAA